MKSILSRRTVPLKSCSRSGLVLLCAAKGCHRVHAMVPKGAIACREEERQR